MPLFSNLESRPQDPILDLLVSYAADQRATKIDLGVGVYKDSAGNTPVMDAIKRAERLRTVEETTKSYLPLGGVEHCSTLLSELLLGSDHPVLQDGRSFSLHTAGGTGGLRLAFELVKRARPGAKVWVSNPSWPNHKPIVLASGLEVAEYPYYDHLANRLDYGRFMDALEQLGASDVVLLHANCHNPSGEDLTSDQWDEVVALAVRRGFLVLVDSAYQGLSEGLDEDAYGARLLASELPEVLLVSSCSKNFGVYRERTGVLTMVGETPAIARAAKSNVTHVARGMYSMAAAHGGVLVASVLANAELRTRWSDELEVMRRRINTIRTTVAGRLDRRFEFIARQRGLFSLLGLNKQQVRSMRKNHAVYMTDSSRINLTGLNTANLERFNEALQSVAD